MTHSQIKWVKSASRKVGTFFEAYLRHDSNSKKNHNKKSVANQATLFFIFKVTFW